MASAVLSTPRILSSPRVRGSRSNFRSSFYGKFLYDKSFIRTEVNPRSRGCTVVTSLFGRTVQKRETVIPNPDYRIPVVLLGFAGGLVYANNLLPAAPIGLLGLLLLFQTTRVRFVFDEDALVRSLSNSDHPHSPR